MTDPVTTTLTASAIATLAFQKAIESGAGELAKKFTTEAIARMDELRKKIWAQLRGKHKIAEETLNKANTGDKQAIDTVATLLGVEMLDSKLALLQKFKRLHRKSMQASSKTTAAWCRTTMTMQLGFRTKLRVVLPISEFITTASRTTLNRSNPL